MNKEEISILVNESDEIIGYKLRNELHKEDIFRSASVLLINEKNEVLLSQRALTKKYNPGKWSVSAAGGVEKGETYEMAAIKEVSEELGISGLKLQPFKKSLRKGVNVRTMNFLYTAKILSSEKITFSKEDIEQVRWFSLSDIIHIKEILPNANISNSTIQIAQEILKNETKTINKTQIKEFLKSNQIPFSDIKEIPVYANQVFHIKGDEEFFFKTFSSVEACRKLKNIYESLQDKLPVPKVILNGDETSELHISFVMLTKVEGQEIAKIQQTASQEDLIHIYQHFGEVVAKLHQNIFDTFGGFDGKKVIDFHELTDIKSTTEYGPFQTWKSMHKQIILSRLELIQEGYFEDIVKDIQSWFENNAHLIEYNITPRLLHIDLNEKNVFVKDNTISGLIDFDDCFIGHNEEELMRIEGGHFSGKPELKEAFFEGYTKHISLDQGYEQRRPYYYLSRLLVHMDCIQEYKENYVKDIEKEVAKVKSEALNIIQGKEITYEANSLE